jgi:hypothetical protein
LTRSRPRPRGRGRAGRSPPLSSPLLFPAGSSTSRSSVRCHRLRLLERGSIGGRRRLVPSLCW